MPNARPRGSALTLFDGGRFENPSQIPPRRRVGCDHGGTTCSSLSVTANLVQVFSDLNEIPGLPKTGAHRGLTYVSSGAAKANSGSTAASEEPRPRARTVDRRKRCG